MPEVVVGRRIFVVVGEYRDIAHPINSGTREKIQSTILGKYEEALEKEPEEEVQEA